ncbi:hypothetical protein SLNSH_07055 [Alsobacter soli]|uniref:Uncharacterized protein n=1 Tax=Alsobacter soli TaxID=2109933 RepID=A0A2T1HVQ7_9HYPH|nr:outer membrane beta-barrel protein [Alsobacter soli]PSC05731.1 hypothetical protein SLNSH_07055 [Alsobacter soli]
MRIVALAALVAAAVPTLARAADYLPLPPVSHIPGPAPEFNWEGLYGGIHVGYDSGDFSASNLGRELSIIAYKDYEIAPQATSLVHLGSSSRQTMSLGGFVGQNWSFDDAVFGVEAEYVRPKSKLVGSSYYDYNYLIGLSALDRWAVAATATGGAGATDYGILKIRGGYAMGRFLPFAGIGLAVGRLESVGYLNGVIRQDTRNQATDPWTIGAPIPISAAIKKSGYAPGLALSAGVDYAPVDNVFLRAQYQYVGFADFKGQRVQLNTVSLGAGVKY